MVITGITNWRIWCSSIPTVTARSMRHRVAILTRCVPYGALVMLERSAGKLARSVLRGLGGCEPAWLPGDLTRTIEVKRAFPPVLPWRYPTLLVWTLYISPAIIRVMDARFLLHGITFIWD